MMQDVPGRAFRDHEMVPWAPAAGYGCAGAEEKVLFGAPGQTYVRLLRWPPNFTTGHHPLRHRAFHEFAWVVAGRSQSLATGHEATPGDYCVVEAGFEHGPFTTQVGVTLLEVRVPATPFMTAREVRS